MKCPFNSVGLEWWRYVTYLEIFVQNPSDYRKISIEQFKRQFESIIGHDAEVGRSSRPILTKKQLRKTVKKLIKYFHNSKTFINFVL